MAIGREYIKAVCWFSIVFIVTSWFECNCFLYFYLYSCMLVKCMAENTADLCLSEVSVC